MKRMLALAAAFVVALGAFAADYTAVAKQILAKNEKRSYSCSFTQVDYLKMMKKEVKSAGTLYTNAGNMAMEYTQPQGDFLVINDKKFVMQKSGKKKDLNVQKNSPFLILRNMLLHCMHGDIEAIAKDNNAEVTYTKEGNLHVFTIAAKGKVSRGYSKVVLKYNTSTLNLQEMTLEKITGDYTVYTLGALKDGTQEASHFVVK